MSSIVQNEDEAIEEPLASENSETNRPKSVRLFYFLISEFVQKI